MTALLALLLLSGFEDAADLDRWKPQGAQVERVHDHATQGQWSLKLTLTRGDYPGIAFTSLAGWERYDIARLDVFNPQSQPVNVTIRLDDAQTTNFGSRYNEDFLLHPGSNTLELPLRQLQTSDHKRNLDPARLMRFLLFGSRPATLYLDNFRLDQGSAASAWPEFKKMDPYFGLDHDWWPEKDVWQEEVLPRLALTDKFTRREFYDKYFYLEPYRPIPNPSKFQLNAARGQTLTIFFNGQPRYLPLEGIPTELRAVRLMERPVGNGVYHIEPMALMPVTNRPHASRFALSIHADQPGTYRGEVDGIPIELHVWPFDLPEAGIAFGFYYDPTPMRDKELRDMAKHGCTTMTAPCPQPKRDGTLDTTRADEFLAACVRAGIAQRQPALVTTLDLGRGTARQMHTTEFSGPFLPVFAETLRQFSVWAKIHRVIANPVDEPREQALESWNRNFADTKRYLELYRAAGIPTLITLTGDESFGKSYLPLLPLMDVVSAHPTHDCAGILRGQTTVHIYNAGMNRLSWGFYPWAIGAKGRWEWHYNFWTDAHNPFASGTGATMPSPDGPLPTEGYERVRAGIDDYRFLMLAEKRPEARKLLEEIRGKIPHYLEGELPGEATLDEWRGKLAAIIAAPAAAAGRNP